MASPTLFHKGKPFKIGRFSNMARHEEVVLSSHCQSVKVNLVKVTFRDPFVGLGSHGTGKNQPGARAGLRHVQTPEISF